MANVYQMVTDRIIEMMNQGLIPWKKPWHGAKITPDAVAISYSSRRAYSTLNQWLLGEPGEYLTFRQVKEHGGTIRKGAKARMVVFYTKVQKVEKNEVTGEEKIVCWPLLKYYNIFHIKDTEGIPSKALPGDGEQVEDGPEMDMTAEAVIAGYLARETALRFQNDKPSDKAYYSPSKDMVVVPMPSQYDDMAEYYSTTFHELTHSTIPASRCDRVDENRAAFFGNHEYSREELVAEIGSAMLCSRTGVDSARSLRNSVGYIQGWIKALKNDPKMIVWAASRAEKAARYILDEKDEIQS